jgi:hypothetical protein
MLKILREIGRRTKYLCSNRKGLYAGVVDPDSVYQEIVGLLGSRSASK